MFKLFGCGLAVAKATSLVLGAATIPPLYLVAERCGGKAAARWAVLFFVLWPAQLIFTSVTAGEHLVLPLALAGFWFGLRLADGQGAALPNAALSGLFLTLAMIVRPSVFAFSAALCLVLLCRLRPWRTCLLSLLIFAVSYLVVDTAYVRLFEKFTGGKFCPTREYAASANLLFGWNYHFAGGWSLEDALLINSWPRYGSMKYAWALTRARIRARGFQQTAVLLTEKDRELWHAPTYALSSATTKLEQPVSPAWLAGPVMAMAADLYQLFIVTACVATAVRFRHGPVLAGAMALPAIIILGTLLHLALVVSSRYSYPFMPVLFVFAALGCAKDAAPRTF